MLVAAGGVMCRDAYGESFGENSEEELSVLPRHTKVVVTGNNRTKSVLVGLQGVVKKAMGLGGSDVKTGSDLFLVWSNQFDREPELNRFLIQSDFYNIAWRLALAGLNKWH